MLHRDFPNLNAEGYVPTSPPTPVYNCIAWAAGDTTHFWWPHPKAHWPAGVPLEETIDAFIAAYKTLGYEICLSGAHEAGVEKIAVYALNGAPKHAARQLPDGTWTSKLGKNIDISHTLAGLVGLCYGDVAFYMSR